MVKADRDLPALLTQQKGGFQTFLQGSALESGICSIPQETSKTNTPLVKTLRIAHEKEDVEYTPRKQRKLEEAFDLLDSDGDGYISYSEIQEWRWATSATLTATSAMCVLRHRFLGGSEGYGRDGRGPR